MQEIGILIANILGMEIMMWEEGFSFETKGKIPLEVSDIVGKPPQVAYDDVPSRMNGQIYSFYDVHLDF